MSMISSSGPVAPSRDSKTAFLRELGLPTLFGAAVLFFSATMLLGVNISAMRTNLSWIENTQRMLLAISQAEAGVVGDELTVRSYALTGDPRFLLFQKVERAKLKKALSELEQLAGAEAGGAARVREIREDVRQHTALYTSVTGLGPDKAVIVGRFINDDAKRAVMFKARIVLAQFRDDEVHILGQRQQDLTQQLSRSFFLAVGIIVAAFLLGGVGLLFSQLRIPLRHQ